MPRLSKEERAELEAKLRADDEADDDEAEFEYEIGQGDRYARVSSKSKAGKKIHTWFKDSFGIDLDDEPVQDVDDEPEPKKPAAKSDSNVKAFRAGRRVG